MSLTKRDEFIKLQQKILSRVESTRTPVGTIIGGFLLVNRDMGICSTCYGKSSEHIYPVLVDTLTRGTVRLKKPVDINYLCPTCRQRLCDFLGVTDIPVVIFRRWLHIRAICEWEESFFYPYYGKIGVRVCEQWKTFEGFLDSFRQRNIKNLNVVLMPSATVFSPDTIYLQGREVGEINNNYQFPALEALAAERGVRLVKTIRSNQFYNIEGYLPIFGDNVTLSFPKLSSVLDFLADGRWWLDDREFELEFYKEDNTTVG